MLRLPLLPSAIAALPLRWGPGTNEWRASALCCLSVCGQADIATLYLVGFGSSALTSPFAGLFADKYGRRTGCMAYTLLLAVRRLHDHFALWPASLPVGADSPVLPLPPVCLWLGLPCCCRCLWRCCT